MRYRSERATTSSHYQVGPDLVARRCRGTFRPASQSYLKVISLERSALEAEPHRENDTVIVSAVAELFDRTVAHVFFGLTAACLMRRWVPEGQASPSAQNACNMASQASPHLHSNKKRHTESIWECLLDLQHIVASKVCVCLFTYICFDMFLLL